MFYLIWSISCYQAFLFQNMLNKMTSQKSTLKNFKTLVTVRMLFSGLVKSLKNQTSALNILKSQHRFCRKFIVDCFHAFSSASLEFWYFASFVMRLSCPSILCSKSKFSYSPTRLILINKSLRFDPRFRVTAFQNNSWTVFQNTWFRVIAATSAERMFSIYYLVSRLLYILQILSF